MCMFLVVFHFSFVYTLHCKQTRLLQQHTLFYLILNTYARMLFHYLHYFVCCFINSILMFVVSLSPLFCLLFHYFHSYVCCFIIFIRLFVVSLSPFLCLLFHYLYSFVCCFIISIVWFVVSLPPFPPLFPFFCSFFIISIYGVLLHYLHPPIISIMLLILQML